MTVSRDFPAAAPSSAARLAMTSVFRARSLLVLREASISPTTSAAKNSSHNFCPSIPPSFCPTLWQRPETQIRGRLMSQTPDQMPGWDTTDRKSILEFSSNLFRAVSDKGRGCSPGYGGWDVDLGNGHCQARCNSRNGRYRTFDRKDLPVTGQLWRQSGSWHSYTCEASRSKLI